MGRPLPDKEKEKVRRNLEKLRGDVEEGAGEKLRESDLPWENGEKGRQEAKLPANDGGGVSISYDPETPASEPYRFKAWGPGGEKNDLRDIPGVEGMKNGEADLPPTQVMPAIEKGTGLNTSQLAAKLLAVKAADPDRPRAKADRLR